MKADTIPASVPAEKPTRNRSEADKEKVRQALMHAAGELLIESGYEGFSLRKVSERAGFSPGNVYLYFQSKDDLLARTIENGFAQFGAQLMQASASTPDPMERIEALGRAYVRFGLENPVYYRLMFLMQTDLHKERNVPGLPTLDLVSQAIRDAMGSGAMAATGKVESTTDALWAQVHGLVSLALIKDIMVPERAHAMIEHYFHHLRRSLELM